MPRILTKGAQNFVNTYADMAVEQKDVSTHYTGRYVLGCFINQAI